jgi:hypothetical protein
MNHLVLILISKHGNFSFHVFKPVARHFTVANAKNFRKNIFLIYSEIVCGKCMPNYFLGFGAVQPDVSGERTASIFRV